MNRVSLPCLAACRTRSRPVTRPPDPASGACVPVPRSPWPLPLAPQAPPPVSRPCSPASSLLWQDPTSRACSSCASALEPSACGPARQRRSSVRPPRFQRDPCVRDGVFDPGRAGFASHDGWPVLSSTSSTGSTPANDCDFVAQWPTPHACCVRFTLAVAGNAATLATRRIATPCLDRTSTGWTTPASWRTEDTQRAPSSFVPLVSSVVNFPSNPPSFDHSLG